jgi:hypothetical protein
VATAVTPPPEGLPSTPADQPASRDGKAQRIAGIAVGGAGVVGLVVGSVLGLGAHSKYNDALSGPCGGLASGCSSQGVADGQSAHSEATASTIVFVVGAALVAGGAVLYFTSPKGVAVSPTVGMQSAGVAVSGRW